ncbi:Transcription factor HHO2 [Hirschfeldia incana]|nr:Transcription factor HHO2 [Hirschfeldia incana]
MEYNQKMQRSLEYVEALKEEQKKIQVFQRELPLCLELVTQAIEACQKELSGTLSTTSSEQCNSEQTASVCGVPVLEEFIPIKKTNNQENESPPREVEKSDVDSKKSDWLRSAHLWDHSPTDQDTTVVTAKKARVVEVKHNSNNRCGFQPFRKETKRVFSETDLQPAAKATTSEPAPATTTCSTTEVVGSAGKEQQPHRKQRRCWSPELHRRFLHALQQLGGSHVATPKQIRDHMKVDGLTNDEVKSHLQVGYY